jgi:hypothetical protein
MTIIKRETEAMGHIHVCNVSAAPCDDPEDQMVVAPVRVAPTRSPVVISHTLLRLSLMQTISPMLTLFT